MFGLAFATALTLIVTPAALMVFSRSNDSKFYAIIRRLFRRGKKVDATAQTTEPPVPGRPAIVASPINWGMANETRRSGIAAVSTYATAELVVPRSMPTT